MAPPKPAVPKILVIDDDNSIRTLLRKFLTSRGLSVVTTDNGSEGLLLVRESLPDLILVDAQMPGLDGHAVCRVIKKEAATRSIPVILMSGSLIADDQVLKGFAGGADDYVVKPFSFPVLLARIEAVLRRCAAPGVAPATFKKHELELDFDGRSVKVGRKPVALTRKEFDLLAALLSKPGRALSVPYLLETVWGYDPADYNDPSTVEVHVHHLRRKLGLALAKRIVNVTGHGYKFEG